MSLIFIQSETRLAAEKNSLEEDFCRVKTENQKMTTDLKDKNKKMYVILIFHLKQINIFL